MMDTEAPLIDEASRLQLAKQMFDSGLSLTHATIVGFDEQDTTYVLKLVEAKQSNQLANHRVAAITSDRCIKVYNWSLHDTNGLQFTHTLEGHSGPVHDCAFQPAQPNVLVTASEDETVALWDLRAGTEPLHVFKSSEASPMFSCDLNDTVIAAGGTSCLSLWDIRMQQQCRLFEDFQTDDILVTKFMPSHPTHIMTGSEDFTICQFDTAVQDDDDALLTVMNTEQPVNRIGFFGPENEYLWATSTIHTLSLWKIQQADRISNFTDIRSQLTQAVGVDVNYLIGCYYNARTERLFCSAGTYGGGVVLSHVQMDSLQPFALLKNEAAHSDVVRDCLVFDQQDKEAVITGGQDSKICVWSTEQREARQINTLSTKETTYSLKREATRRKTRSPY